MKAVENYKWNEKVPQGKDCVGDIEPFLPDYVDYAEAATGGVLLKKVLLKFSQNSQENTRVGVSFLIKLQASACNSIKKRDCEIGIFLWIWEIFNNTFFDRTPLVIASEYDYLRIQLRYQLLMTL